MDNKRKYIEFSTQQALPLHMQPWWLDAVCGAAHWEVALSFDGEQKINGALPYFLTTSHGLSSIRMPAFTDYAGIWLQLPNAPDIKQERRYDIEIRIISTLCGQLPTVVFYDQSFYPDFENWLPFYWQGFRQTTRYTYVLDGKLAPDAVYEAFRSSLKKDLRKAERTVRAVVSDDAEAFYQIYQTSFSRQNLPTSHGLEAFLQMNAAAKAQNCRRIYLAQDAENAALHAGLYVVWDAQTAYFLLSGADANLRSSGALFLLQWQAIQDFLAMGLGIDFCGSVLPNVENAMRAFGAVRVPHFRIYKARNRFWRLLAVAFGKDY